MKGIEGKKGILRQSAERPRIELESTSFELMMSLAAWLGVAVHVMVVVFYWPRLPSQVPQHFNARGEVDAWGPLGLLLLLPGLSLAMVAGFSWLMRYPHRYNFPWPITEENAYRQYRLANELLVVIKAVIAWLLCLMTWEICRLAIGEPALLGAFFLPVGLVPLFGAIAWYFVRAYRER